MQNIILFLILFGALLGLSLPAAAGPAALFNTYFGKAQDGTVCFARTYDNAHLEKHPVQKVEIIEIDMAKFNLNGSPNTPDFFDLGFGIRLRTSPDWYGQAATCKTEVDGFRCFLEGDGGLFRLTPEGPNSLKLETGNYGIALEGAKDAITLDGNSGGDKVFILNASRAECDAARSFFNTKNE